MESRPAQEDQPTAAGDKDVEEKPAPERKPVKVDNVVIYRDRAGEWRWKARSKNNKIITESGEGYRNRPWARKMALDLYPDARVVWGPK